MFSKLIVLISALFTLSACCNKFITYKVNEKFEKQLSKYNLYYLPQIQLNISIKASCTQYILGPFSEYAFEYLGVKNVISQTSEKWQIESIDVKTISVPDYSKLFIINGNLSLNQKNEIEKFGLIFNENNLNNTPLTANNTTINNNTSFNELSFTNFVYETADTFYKTILKDSLYIKLPIIKPRTEITTLKEKANEAANFIMKLRQIRNEYIMQEEGSISDPNTLQIALNEIEKLENRYLELFTGRIIKMPVSKNINFTPQLNNINKCELLCYFSENSGFLGVSDTSNSIYVSFSDLNTKPNETSMNKSSSNIMKANMDVPLDLNEQKRLSKENNYFKTIKQIIPNHIIYRIPVIANCSIIYKNTTLISGQIPVLQFGNEVPQYVK